MEQKSLRIVAGGSNLELSGAVDPDSEIALRGWDRGSADMCSLITKKDGGIEHVSRAGMSSTSDLH